MRKLIFVNHCHDPNTKRKLYPMKTVTTVRMRTGSNPYPGVVTSRSEIVGIYPLEPKEVEKRGIVGAYFEQERKHFELLRADIARSRTARYEKEGVLNV